MRELEVFWIITGKLKQILKLEIRKEAQKLKLSGKFFAKCSCVISYGMNNAIT
jgi:hypothetical protein